MKNSQTDSYLEVAEAASPPNPTKNKGFRDVHLQIIFLQHIGRLFAGIAISALDEDAQRGVDWTRFFTLRSNHRRIAGGDELEQFLLSKLRQ